MNNNSKDSQNTIPHIVLDEIGLEGLDGITLEALWKRLSQRLKLTLPLNDNFCNTIWSFIINGKCLEFYKLPEPRTELQITDRSYAFNLDFENTNENKLPPSTSCKYKPIELNGVRGSCESFEKRIQIERNEIMYLSLMEINDKYGQTFVIVGSQKLRESCIMSSDKQLAKYLNLTQYCLLERIARARFNGEVTTAQGAYSLYNITCNQTLCYLRNSLEKSKLIVKQSFIEKNGELNVGGYLLHLPRFYVEFKTKHMLIIEKIVTILQRSLNHIMDVNDLSLHFNLDNNRPFRRIFKSTHFQKFLSIEIVKYRALYPTATAEEYQVKSNKSERLMRVIKLRDPNLSVADMWSKDNDDEEQDDEQDEQNFLDTSNQCYHLPIYSQIYNLIASRKSEGINNPEISKYFGMTRLNVRSILRKLIFDKKIKSYYAQCGRQKTSKYILSKYENVVRIPFDSEPAYQLETDPIDRPDTIEEESTYIKQQQTSDIEEDDSRNCVTLTYCEDAPATATDNTITDSQCDETLPAVVDNNNVSESSVITMDMQNRNDLDKIIVNIKELDKPSEYLKIISKRHCELSDITERMRFRMRVIIAILKRHKIVDDLTKLFTLIIREDSKRYGEQIQMCRKTMNRLLLRLCNEKCIRMWAIVFSCDGKELKIMFITNPKISSDDSYFQGCVERAKAKFMITLNTFKVKQQQPNWLETDENIFNKEPNQASKIHSLFNKSQLNRKKNLPIIKKRIVSVVPKFIRSRLLHEFLHYIVYEHNENITCYKQSDMIEHWKSMNPFIDYDEITKDVPNDIYTNEINWKMFIPPLIKYPEYTNGWFLLYDIILIMPFSLFINVFNLELTLSEFELLLAHPIRQHYLIKDLPQNIHSKLMLDRKIIYSLIDELKRLCLMGLLQFGPQILRDKEQMFIYVNRHTIIHDTTIEATLLNTTTTTTTTETTTVTMPAKTPKDCPIIFYTFNTSDDVGKYWLRLFEICRKTNAQLIPTKNDTTAEFIKKRNIIYEECYKSRTPGEVTAFDCGRLPGDGLGAAGLDTMLFPHVLRNWIQNTKRKDTRKRLLYGTVLHGPKPNKRTDFGKIKKRIIVPVRRIKQPDGTIILKRRIMSNNRKLAQKRVRRNVYDNVDKTALKSMKNLRVKWNTAEDNLLLLCKIGAMYLCPDVRKQLINFRVIRDVLHWSCKSYDKTSTACHRRINYRMKNSKIPSSIHLCLQEINQNVDIQRMYNARYLDKLRVLYTNDDDFNTAVSIHYIDLIFMLTKIFKFSANTTTFLKSNAFVLPKTMTEYHRMYIEKTEDYKQYKRLYENPRTIEDIEISVLVTLLHSSICCAQDKTSYNLQLFDIYKNYSEEILSKSMQKIRTDQLISFTKSAAKTGNRTLPLGAGPYHLSFTYQNQMVTKITYDIFSESYAKLKEFWTNSCDQSLEYNKCTQSNGGITYIISELFLTKMLNVKIVLPERFLVPDVTKRTIPTDENSKARSIKFYEKIVNDNDDSSSSPHVLIDQKISSLKAAASSSSSSASSTANVYVTVEKELEKLPIVHYHFFCLFNKHMNANESIGRNLLILDEMKYCEFNCIIDRSENVLQTIQTILKNNKFQIKDIFSHSLNNNNNNANELKLNALNFLNVYNELLKLNNFKDTEKMIKELKDHIFTAYELLKLNNDVAAGDDDDGNGIGRKDTNKNQSTSVTLSSQTTQTLDNNDFNETNIDDLSELNLESIHSYADKIHRYHDLLYLKPCDILLRLNERHPLMIECKQNGAASNDEMDIKSFLPHYEKNKEMVLKYISRTSIWAQQYQEEEINALFKNDQDEQILFINVLQYIEESKEFGVLNKNLAEHFHNSKLLSKVVSELIKMTVILRIGVNDFTYVYWKHARPWLLSSYHMKRLERESIQPVKYNNKMKQSNNKVKNKSNLNADKELSLAEIIAIKRKHQSMESDIVKIDDDDDNNDSTTSGVEPQSKRSKRSTSGNKKGSDVPVQSNPRNSLFVKLYPWIRFNGSLNRRVLDKWMGTLLAYCMSHPGITINRILNRFNVLQPTHIRELLEYLEILHCIEMYTITETKPTLFSSGYGTQTLEPATELDDIENIFINITHDAVTKMSYFIGDKKYDKEFI